MVQPPSSTPLFHGISALLDDVQSALMTQDADRIEQACKALMQGFSSELGRHSRVSIQSALLATEAESLASRFGLLRQALAQSAAANERQLSSLLPDQLPGAYGGKSAFGPAVRSRNLKSYQA